MVYAQDPYQIPLVPHPCATPLAVVSQNCTLISHFLHFFNSLNTFFNSMVYSQDPYQMPLVPHPSATPLAVVSQNCTLISHFLHFLILLIFSSNFNDLIWSMHRIPIKYHWFLIHVQLLWLW